MRGSRFLLATALLALAHRAHGASPSIEGLNPRGSQRGGDLHLTITGQRLADAEELLLFRPGISVLQFEVEDDRKVSMHLRIAEDCALGAHPFVLRTRSGLSNFKTFHVGPLRETREVEPNGSWETAQEIQLERTIDGVLDREDEDWYRFAIAAPTTVSFDFEGVRLGDVLLDAELQIFDAAGKRIARCDDSTLGRLDPIGSFVFEEPGTYYVQVHETTPSGSNRAGYRLHVGTFPRPLVAVPSGVEPGTPTPVTFVGATGTFEETVTVEPSAFEEIAWFPTHEGRTAPTPLPLVAKPVRIAVEGATGDDPADVEEGMAWHGILSENGETDRFAFSARKGRTYVFAVHARSLRSPIDPSVYLVDEKGKYITGNDDTRGRLDSALRWQAPADGTYRICIRDQLRRGGPLYAYRIEVRARGRGPLGRVDTRTVAYPLPVVPRAGRTAALLRVDGLPREGRFQPRWSDVPPGVSVTVPEVSREQDTVPVLFECGEDARPAGALSRLALVPVAEENLVEDAFVQTFTLVEVQGNRPYTTVTIDRLPIAIADVAPFTIDVDPPRVPIVQGAPLSIDVSVTRREEFTGTVRLRLLWDPPGVSTGQRSVGGNQTKDAIPLNARGDAPPGRYTLCVVGYGDTKTGRFVSSSALFELEVTEPWLRATLQNVRTEAGQDATLQVTVEPTERLKQPCEFEWLYLPKGVTTAKQTLTVESGEIAFPLALSKDAAIGRHRNPTLRVNVQTEAGPVTHLFRGAEVRVDRPRDPEKESKQP
ncbi:MAG: PPC domain-containing protein [Planctomycetes bacterium]|nr:PPC domain-containing protein [Planctomycetota bacterium]